jgi:hypothetical protein
MYNCLLVEKKIDKNPGLEIHLVPMPRHAMQKQHNASIQLLSAILTPAATALIFVCIALSST